MKMSKEDILYFFITIFCCLFIVALLSLPLELVYALFMWQPIAGRVFIYGLAIVLCFYTACDRVEIEKIDGDDDKWQR